MNASELLLHCDVLTAGNAKQPEGRLRKAESASLHDSKPSMPMLTPW
jgi:hypothetical protein